MRGEILRNRINYLNIKKSLPSYKLKLLIHPILRSLQGKSSFFLRKAGQYQQQDTLTFRIKKNLHGNRKTVFCASYLRFLTAAIDFLLRSCDTLIEIFHMERVLDKFQSAPAKNLLSLKLILQSFLLPLPSAC